ncbi:Uncharacterised protein [Campylobacter hyointestinalis]|uniref:hypothetical protein n=1 Tax=Campylobacter hyointestinalis TaxID=198 RepID=UPI000723D670|nr:hypothetical protein [Campylobacter hyointestinalis]CUU89217.1 Uncharacterised protein [Campylobacter hyointestinalis]
MVVKINYDEITKNRYYDVIDLFKNNDIYITKSELQRKPFRLLENNKLILLDIMLNSLVKNEYFIEEKEIDGNMVKVYDTPFWHKIMVASSSLDLKNICKKTDTKETKSHTKQARFFTLLIFIGICYLFYYLIK